MATEFRLEWAQWPEYATASGDVRQTVRNVVGGRMRRAMQKIADDARSHTPYQKIADAYRVEQSTSGGSVGFSIYNDSPLFPFREYDTKPHVIRATNKPWLVFEPRGAGHLVQVKEVQHPGTHGTHTLQEAWDRGADPLSAAVDGAFDAILSRLGNYSGE